MLIPDKPSVYTLESSEHMAHDLGELTCMGSSHFLAALRCQSIVRAHFTLTNGNPEGSPYSPAYMRSDDVARHLIRHSICRIDAVANASGSEEHGQGSDTRLSKAFRKASSK